MSGVLSSSLRFLLRFVILFLVFKGSLEVLAYNKETAARLEDRSRDVFRFAKNTLDWHL